MKDLKTEFPILNNFTYLNTASSGLLPSSVLEWRKEHDVAFLLGGSIFREAHKEHLMRIKETMSNFLGSDAAEMALVPNFSFGCNSILEGLPQKTKILLLDGDYPSINWAVEQRDFEIFYAEIDEHLELNIEDAVAKYKPDVLAISIVQYISGIMVDLDFIKKLKTTYPEMIIMADGTQFLGTRRFNFAESGIDILGASCYKWLLGGYGNGFFLVKKSVQDRLLPKTIGFNSAFAMYSKREEIEFIKLLEPGHQDTLNFGSLEKSVQLLQKCGMETIEGQVSNLSQVAKEKFAEMGLLEAKVLKREKHSSIFNIKGDEALFNKMKKNKIITSQRGKGIRVSFHFYNSVEDLEKLLEIVKC